MDGTCGQLVMGQDALACVAGCQPVAAACITVYSPRDLWIRPI